MAEYLMLKHYRGGRPAVNSVPMDQLTPEEWSALELAAELSAAPWAGGAPLGEWLELREVMSAAPIDA